jgi:hypothetical protein
MKHILLTLAFLVSLNSFAVTKQLKLGFAFSPGIGWLSPQGKELKKANPRFYADYGLVVEYFFKPNYGISTGLYGSYEGGNISGRKAFSARSVNIKDVNEQYIIQTLSLPISLKLKTNEIKKKFHFYGQVGFTFNFFVSSRANFNDAIAEESNPNSIVSIEKENIYRKDNEVTRLIPKFRSNFADVRLQVGAGVEYKLNDKTFLLMGFYFNNGLVNIIKDYDAKNEKIYFRNVALRMGVLF